MFPISDSTPKRTFPIVNYIIILVNVIIFILEISAVNVEAFISQYAFIPSTFKFSDPSSYFQIFSSMWLHGGWFHLIANMWFLHIFGDNVEDDIGHSKYLFFYIAGGVAAVFAQYIFIAQTNLPLIGASGAISAVAGAYFVLHRHAKIKTLIAAFYFWDIIELPSFIFLGYWFIIQIFSGIGSLVATAANQGGVAFFAHAGGFIFGYFIGKIVPQSYFE